MRITEAEDQVLDHDRDLVRLRAAVAVDDLDREVRPHDDEASQGVHKDLVRDPDLQDSTTMKTMGCMALYVSILLIGV